MSKILRDIEKAFILKDIHKQVIGSDLIRVKTLLHQFGIFNNDPRLAITNPKKGKLAISLNKRYIYCLRVEKNWTRHSFILPRQYYEDTVSKNIETSFEYFSGDKAGLISPVLCRIPLETDISKLPEFFEQWAVQCYKELNRGKSSPYKKYHKEYLYEDIMNFNNRDDNDNFESNIQNSQSAGAGFGTSEENRIIESAAMEFVTQYYESLHYIVEDVSKQNLGYDVIARKNGVELHVEVKGVSGSGKEFILTQNELNTLRTDDSYVITLVNNAITNPAMTILYSKDIPDESIRVISYFVSLN